MQITIDLPEYVVDVLTREAEFTQTSLDAVVAKEAQDKANTMMWLWRGLIEDRTCHKCGENNNALHEFDLAHKGPWRTCVACGNRLSADRDRKETLKVYKMVIEGEALVDFYEDLDKLLRRARKMREAMGATPRKHESLRGKEKRQTFAESMREAGFSDAAIERMKAM